MKKILFVLVLFLSCYIVYFVTEKEEYYYLSLGDGLGKSFCDNSFHTGYDNMISDYLKNEKKLEKFNNLFVDYSYRITDLIRMIRYNDYVYDVKGEVYINQALKRSDIITLSIGNNELYSRLLMDNGDIFGYIHEMLDDMETLLELINRYNHKLVFVTGFYNNIKGKEDIVKYVNLELSDMAKNNGFIYVDVSFIGDNLKYLNDKCIKVEDYNKIFQIIVEKIKNS